MAARSVSSDDNTPKWVTMRDSYYVAAIDRFLQSPSDAILGELARAHQHALEHQQRNAWLAASEPTPSCCFMARYS
jgi:hypothetical protein